MTDPILAALLAADDELTETILAGAERQLRILEAAVRNQRLRRHLATEREAALRRHPSNRPVYKAGYAAGWPITPPPNSKGASHG